MLFQLLQVPGIGQGPRDVVVDEASADGTGEKVSEAGVKGLLMARASVNTLLAVVAHLMDCCGDDVGGGAGQVEDPDDTGGGVVITMPAAHLFGVDVGREGLDLSRVSFFGYRFQDRMDPLLQHDTLLTRAVSGVS